MTEQKAIEQLISILNEATKDENSVCYVTSYDEEPLRIAIKSLEKQVPKEPSQLLKHIDYFHWECPTCHMSYGMATQKVKYCYTCGQAIKWE